MLTNIRFFEISIERVNTIFKHGQQEPLVIKQQLQSNINHN
jgi:hypothetical protein